MGKDMKEVLCYRIHSTITACFRRVKRNWIFLLCCCTSFSCTVFFIPDFYIPQKFLQVLFGKKLVSYHPLDPLIILCQTSSGVLHPVIPWSIRSVKKAKHIHYFSTWLSLGPRLSILTTQLRNRTNHLRLWSMNSAHRSCFSEASFPRSRRFQKRSYHTLNIFEERRTSEESSTVNAIWITLQKLGWNGVVASIKGAGDGPLVMLRGDRMPCQSLKQMMYIPIPKCWCHARIGHDVC